MFFDSNGYRIGRGTRVLVRFEDHGPEHAPFEWTGRVMGPSNISGRVRIKSEYVTWKGPIHLVPAGEPGSLGGYTIRRLPDQKHDPIEYHEYRDNGRHVVRDVA